MKSKILALLLSIYIVAGYSFNCFAAGNDIILIAPNPNSQVSQQEDVISEEVLPAEEVKEETSSGLPKPKKPVSSDSEKIENEKNNPFVSFIEGLKKNFYNTFIKEERWKLFTEGFRNTVFIAICSTLLGTLIGMVVALIKVFKTQIDNPNWFIKLLNAICSVYTTIVRGTPAVVQLFIAYYIIFKTSDNYIFVAIMAFGFNSGAYVSEIVRAGIVSVDRGQLEAGRSLGLSHIKTMMYIILPQAFKNILPALGNEFITLLKDTSIAGYIGTLELMKAGNIVRSRTFEPYFSLLSVAAVYLICVIGMEQVLKSVERRLAKSDRH